MGALPLWLGATWGHRGRWRCVPGGPRCPAACSAAVRTGRLEPQARSCGDHRRSPRVNGVDDLEGVDASEIDRGHPEVGVPELALDDVERNALTRQFDGVSVTQLMRCEAPTHAGPGLPAAAAAAAPRLPTML